MSYSNLLLVFCALCAVSVAVGAQGESDTSVVFHTNPSRPELGVLLLTPRDLSRPQLFSFSADTSAESLLKSDLLTRLCGSTNAVSDAFLSSVASVGKKSLASALLSHDLKLIECRSGVSFPFLQAEIEPHHSHVPFDKLDDPEFLERSRLHWETAMSKEREWPYSTADMVADGIDEALMWAWYFVTNHFGEMHEFNTYKNQPNDTGIYHLDTGLPLSRTGERPVGSSSSSGPVNIAMTADWGSGTQESAYVADLMVSNFSADYTIHLGDVYTVGAPAQIESNALGIPPPNCKNGVKFPDGKRGTFAINGNHEMFSRGMGYFDHWLPKIGLRDPVSGQFQGQKASFFMLENDNWRVIALDTGYTTYTLIPEWPREDAESQPQEVLDWLRDTVKIGNPDDTRGIVFISHHQYRSAFSDPSLNTAKQLEALLPPGRRYLWIWGHEHRLAWYNAMERDDVNLVAYARCIGVGGFPTSLGPLPPHARESGLLAYDDRPAGVIHGLKDEPKGHNSYVHITFDGGDLSITYKSLIYDNGVPRQNESDTLVEERFYADPLSGNVTMSEFNVINKNITVVQSEL